MGDHSAAFRPISRAVGPITRIRELLGQLRPARTPEVETRFRPAWLIAGLGNPGSRYQNTRHNVGFLCIDRLAERQGLRFDQRGSEADLAQGLIADQPVWMVKPRTYMNRSGQVVGPLLRQAGLAPERLLVIYDDLDLELGLLRLRPGGGSGGHNGIRSLIDAVGTPDFPRLRVGISRPPSGSQAVEYVLSEFGPDDWPVVEAVRDRISEAVIVVLGQGIEAAMNQFNRRAV